MVQETSCDLEREGCWRGKGDQSTALDNLHSRRDGVSCKHCLEKTPIPPPDDDGDYVDDSNGGGSANAEGIRGGGG